MYSKHVVYSKHVERTCMGSQNRTGRHGQYRKRGTNNHTRVAELLEWCSCATHFLFYFSFKSVFFLVNTNENGVYKEPVIETDHLGLWFKVSFHCHSKRPSGRSGPFRWITRFFTVGTFNQRTADWILDIFLRANHTTTSK